MTRAITLVCFVATLFGCSNAARRGGSGGSGGTGGGANDTLVVTPADAAVEVDGATLPTLDYQAHDKSGNDVTSACTFAVEDSSLGSFSGATFHASGMAGGI